MILILGSSGFEQGTDPVIDWLLHYKADFIKLTVEDIINGHLRIDLQQKEAFFKDIPLVEKTSIIWYRHFLNSLARFKVSVKRFSAQLNEDLRAEVKGVFEVLAYLLKDKTWVPGHLPSIQPNKLEVLLKAEIAGLRVPQTHITSSREEAIAFCQKSQYATITTKQISDEGRNYYQEGEYAYYTLTKKLSEKELTAIENSFFPSLLQEYIYPDYEIRTFYLDGKTYSTAIVNNKTSAYADRKLINEERATHFVPYQLPESVIENTRRLMEGMGMTAGGIDFIRDQKGDYYFLEVNPIGQYLLESRHCNYYLEKEIAAYLIGVDTKREVGQKTVIV